MSRYPPNRWDADRLARERDYRGGGGYYDDYYGPPPAVEPPRRVSRAAPVAPVYDDRYEYEYDRYGPRGARETRYYEEDEYYDPRTRNAQMIPYRPARPEAPPRPGIIRRQSSLDTFDRAPPRRFDEYERPRPQPQRVDMRIAEAPSPRTNRYQRREPAYRRDYYDDIAIQDPDYYGDDGFREYREREWISSRRRDSPSPARSKATTETTEKEEVVEEKSSKETIIEEKEEKKEEKGEKPYPRKGKTKMPKRLVHTKVLADLGYKFYEENEKTIVIEAALGPDNIDEIFVKSKEYREKDVSTTRLLEAPPEKESETVTKTTTTIEIGGGAPTIREPSPAPESVKEEKVSEEITTKSISEAPRSVREWDALSADTRSTRRHRSHSRRHRRSPSPEVVKQIIIERSPSRNRSRRRSKSRRRPGYDEEIIERRIIRDDDDFDESASLSIGPLALVRDHPRTNREIEEEIEILQAERRRSRRNSRRERRLSRDEEYIELVRADSSSPSPVREMMVERRGDNMVLKREKPRSRSKSIPRPPSARQVRNMMYTLT